MTQTVTKSTRHVRFCLGAIKQRRDDPLCRGRFPAPGVEQGGHKSHKTSGSKDAAGDLLSGETHPNGRTGNRKHDDRRQPNAEQPRVVITGVLERDPLLVPLHVRLDHAQDESGATGVDR